MKMDILKVKVEFEHERALNVSMTLLMQASTTESRFWCSNSFPCNVPQELEIFYFRLKVGTRKESRKGVDELATQGRGSGTIY